MDPVEVREKCDTILSMYKYDFEMAHVEEDVLVLNAFRAAVQALQEAAPSHPSTSQLTECLDAINRLTKQERSKYFA